MVAVIKFLLGTMLIVSLTWLVADPGFAPAMLVAVSFAGLATVFSCLKEAAQMQI